MDEQQRRARLLKDYRKHRDELHKYLGKLNEAISHFEAMKDLAELALNNPDSMSPLALKNARLALRKSKKELKWRYKSRAEADKMLQDVLKDIAGL